MAFATIEDLLDIDPTIQDYGYQDFDSALEKAEADVIKMLKARWWPGYIKYLKFSSSANPFSAFDATLLDETQWTQITCYIALGYYILPKLSKFETDEDRFLNMMEYYTKRAEQDFDLEVRSGVSYDFDEDDTFSDEESAPTEFLRLRR
jgi:hypothetical protein